MHERSPPVPSTHVHDTKRTDLTAQHYPDIISNVKLMFWALPIFWRLSSPTALQKWRMRRIQFWWARFKEPVSVTVYVISSAQWLFSVPEENKEILKGRHFDYIDDIRSNTMAALKAIPQNRFQNCFEGWTRRWHQCIASQGEYFEGDHGGIQQWGM